MNNIIYTICGNPNLETTQRLIESSNNDLIILGIPFSDPIAEAPNIQTDSTIALKNGTTVKKIFQMLEKCEKKAQLAFKTYANVIYSYGADRFISKCKEVGISSLIIPDLPYEERDEFIEICHQYDICLISIIASNTPNRVKKIISQASGFIYLSTRPQDNLILTINEIKKYSALPIVIDQELQYI